jgi:choloylglycine hydrolase
MVDITFLGVAEKDWFNLDELPLENRRLLLEAPSLPFDGMNEQGLAIGMAAVPSGHRVRDPAKPTIGSIGIIRRVLDEARNVEEALAIFENYNVSMGEGPEIHYLLADRSGTAILIEYIEGEMVVTPQEHPWHQATNFLVGSFDDPQGLCWRYDRIAENLQAAQGVLTPDQALDLLMDVSQDVTQWSAVYSLSTGEVRIALGGEGGEVLTFTLKAP